MIPNDKSENGASPIGRQGVGAIWLIEPAAQANDPVWQGRTIFRLAVHAASPAMARLVADRWASANEVTDSRRPGFEDQLLYHVHQGPDSLAGAFGPDNVLVIGEPIPTA